MADTPALSGEPIAHLLEENQRLRQEREHLKQQHAQLQEEREQLRQQNGQLQQNRDELKDEVKELKRLIFGSKKERFIPAPVENQLSLLLGEDASQPALPLKQTVHYERIVKQVTKKASRQLFPAHLPRVEVIIQPEADVTGMRKMDLPIRSCILGPFPLLTSKRKAKPIGATSESDTIHKGLLFTGEKAGPV